MAENVLLKITDLKIWRGEFCLDVPDLVIPAGEVVGLVGPNGAGKSTLLEGMAGLRKLNSGHVSALGQDPWTHPEVRTELGFMSDDMPVFDMKIGRLLNMVSGYYPDWDPDLVMRLVADFDIDLNRKPDALSRGQGARLRLILAMAFMPKLLLLDEPAAGLDVAGRHALIKEVLDVVRDEGRTVIMSSHSLVDVERIADRLVVLNKGQVVRQGPTDELIGDESTLEEALVNWGAAG